MSSGKLKYQLVLVYKQMTLYIIDLNQVMETYLEIFKDDHLLYHNIDQVKDTAMLLSKLLTIVKKSSAKFTMDADNETMSITLSHLFKFSCTIATNTTNIIREINNHLIAIKEENYVLYGIEEASVRVYNLFTKQVSQLNSVDWSAMGAFECHCLAYSLHSSTLDINLYVFKLDVLSLVNRPSLREYKELEEKDPVLFSQFKTYSNYQDWRFFNGKALSVDYIIKETDRTLVVTDIFVHSIALLKKVTCFMIHCQYYLKTFNKNHDEPDKLAYMESEIDAMVNFCKTTLEEMNPFNVEPNKPKISALLQCASLVDMIGKFDLKNDSVPMDAFFPIDSIIYSFTETHDLVKMCQIDQDLVLSNPCIHAGIHMNDVHMKRLVTNVSQKYYDLGYDCGIDIALGLTVRVPVACKETGEVEEVVFESVLLENGRL